MLKFIPLLSELDFHELSQAKAAAAARSRKTALLFAHFSANIGAYGTQPFRAWEHIGWCVAAIARVSTFR